MLHDKPPALEGQTCSEVVVDNLNAMHAARKAFVENESNEKIRRALRHNIHTSGDTKYFTGDMVYFKSDDCPKWRGPGTVLGQDNQQVLVKHDSIYVCVHPCRLRLVNQDSSVITEFSEKIVETNEKKMCLEEDIDSDDDDDSNDGEPKNNETGDTTNDLIDDIEENDGEDDNISVVDDEMNRNVSDKELQPKKMQNVKYLPVGDDSWRAVKVIPRAGKRTGKYKDWFNVEYPGGK